MGFNNQRKVILLTTVDLDSETALIRKQAIKDQHLPRQMQRLINMAELL